MSKLTKAEIICWLKSEGWMPCHTYHRDAEMLYKSFAGYPDCLSNQRKKKQVEIYLFQHDNWLLPEVECVGEIQGGFWHVSKVYGFEPTKEGINRAVEIVLKTWTAAARLRGGPKRPCAPCADDNAANCEGGH